MTSQPMSGGILSHGKLEPCSLCGGEVQAEIVQFDTSPGGEYVERVRCIDCGDEVLLTCDGQALFDEIVRRQGGYIPIVNAK